MNATEDMPEPSEIEAMLPWHAAGTLDRSDARRVEEALARDPELARRYAAVREEFNSTWQVNETLGAPSPRAMASLFAKIEAEPKRRAAVSFDIAGAFSRFIESLSSRTRAVAAAVAGLVVVLQGGLLGVLATQAPQVVYSTASAPSAAPAKGAYVLARFAADAKATEITSLLEANDATIASGPTPGGFYRLQVAPKPLPKDKLAAIAHHLKQDKLFDFVSVSE
jgi:anti-sigma factor RsiW